MPQSCSLIVSGNSATHIHKGICGPFPGNPVNSGMVRLLRIFSTQEMHSFESLLLSEQQPGNNRIWGKWTGKLRRNQIYIVILKLFKHWALGLILRSYSFHWMKGPGDTCESIYFSGECGLYQVSSKYSALGNTCLVDGGVTAGLKVEPAPLPTTVSCTGWLQVGQLCFYYRQWGWAWWLCVKERWQSTFSSVFIIKVVGFHKKYLFSLL